MSTEESIKITSTPLENERRSVEAMKRVPATQVNEPQAMFRKELGRISFRWGDKSSGIDHLIKRHIAEDGMTRAEAETFIRSLPGTSPVGGYTPSTSFTKSQRDPKDSWSAISLGIPPMAPLLPCPYA